MPENQKAQNNPTMFHVRGGGLKECWVPLAFRTANSHFFLGKGEKNKIKLSLHILTTIFFALLGGQLQRNGIWERPVRHTLLFPQLHKTRHHPNCSILFFCPLCFLQWCGPLEISYLLDEIVLFIAELLVLWAVCLELAQELHQFGLVLQQDVQNRWCLIWICHKHLISKQKACLNLKAEAI